MFVAVYIAGAAGAITAAGLPGLVEFTIGSLLPVVLLVTAAAILALHVHLFRRNGLGPADLGFRRPTPRLFHLLRQIPVAVLACGSLQGIVLLALTID